MSIEDTLEILTSAKDEGRGIGAFNVVSLVQMMAVRDVAETLKYPLLIQTSVATASFYTPELLVSIFRAVFEKSNVPVALHLDHCRDIGFAKRCVDAGYNSVMVDFSKESYMENISKTKEMVEYCKRTVNVAVEGEVGIIPGVEDDISSSNHEEFLCTPEMAYDFVKRTGISFFAPAIGTAHGIYKTKNPLIDYERLKHIDEYLKNRGVYVPLVVHGCSGLPEYMVKKLIKSGASKFNVSTDIKQRVIKALKHYFDKNPDGNNTLELEKITRYETFNEVKRWLTIFVENYK